MVPHPGRLRLALIVLGSAAAVALVFGVAEVLVHGFRSLIGERFIWSSRQVGWMAPASYVAFLVTVAGPFALLAVAWPRWQVVAAAVVASTVVAAVPFLRLATAQRIHPAAITLLACAAGFQFGRMVLRSRDRWPRRVAVILVSLGGLVLGWAVLSNFWWARKSEAAGARGVPNVLLLVLDTVRGENLSLYGYGRATTPNLERLAAAGVVYDHAFSPAPWTLPSHAALFTGRPPWELSAGFLRKLDDAEPTLAERFAASGYRTGGFVGNHIYASWESGLARGFAEYRDYPISLRQILLSSEIGQMVSSQRSSLAIRAADRPRAPDVNAEFLDWQAADPEAPFFAFLNYMDAHLPYRTPADWEARFAGDSAIVDRYDAAVAFVDDQIGTLLGELERRGVLDRTIVVVTADHGEHLGDHGLDDHANSLYTQLTRVPLVIAGPGVPAGTRVAGQVSLTDVAATLTQLTGTAALPGTPLSFAEPPTDSIIVTAVERHPLGRSWFRNGTGPLWSALDHDYHLILGPGPDSEIFNYRDDPSEARPLTNDPGAEAARGRLLAAIRAARSGAVYP